METRKQQLGSTAPRRRRLTTEPSRAARVLVRLLGSRSRSRICSGFRFWCLFLSSGCSSARVVLCAVLVLFVVCSTGSAAACLWACCCLFLFCSAACGCWILSLLWGVCGRVLWGLFVHSFVVGFALVGCC
ncbi:hypothetical protein Q3G72_032840 [Acer saccharum]|nr:hypothetical protein Q3G72_032840 [Acer saccharum]